MRKHFSLAGLALALVLAGCGSGGGGGDGEPAAPLPMAQGFWNGAIAGSALDAAYARAVVLDDGRTWVFLHEDAVGGLRGLVTGRLAASADGYSGSGTRYEADGRAGGSVDFNAGAASASAWRVSAVRGGASSTLDLAPDARYGVAATAAAVAGTWNFTQAGGSITGAWTIDGAGRLAGLRTPGCSYDGSVTPYGATAVYEVALVESCSGEAPVRFEGIAKLNSEASFLTFGIAKADGSMAQAFVAGR